MNPKNLTEAVVQIVDLFDADLPLEYILEEVCKVVRVRIPADHMGFHLAQFGLNFRCGQEGLHKTPVTYWQQKDSVSAMRWVMAHGKPLKRDHLVEEERFTHDKERIRNGVKSQMVVPLIRKDETIGTMSFASKSTAQFTDAHLSECEIYARLISARLHQLYLSQETAGIGRLSQAIQSSSDLDHILFLVLEHIQSLGYDRVRIYLYDEQDHSMVGARQAGISPLTHFKDVRLPMASDPHSQRTFENFEPCIFRLPPNVSVTYADLRFIFGDQIPQEKAELPLFVVNQGQKSIVGKISLDNVISGRPLRQDNLKRLMIYATQTANAIWKAQMYQEMKREVEKRTVALRARAKQREGLLKVNRDVQRLQRSADMQEVIVSFYKNLVDMGFDFRVLTIHRLIDDQRKIFEAYEVMDEHIYRKHVSAYKRIFAIWEKGHVHYRRNLHEDLVDLKPGFIERAQKDIGCTLASTLSVPLGRGVISLLSTSVEAFGEDAIHLFEQLAGILSVGLDRVHDLEHVEKENQRQVALAMIGQAVQKMNHPRELGDVGRVFLKGVKHMGIDAHAVAIHRIVDSGENVVETFRVLETGDVIFVGKRKSDALVAVWQSGQYLIESDMEQTGNRRLANFRRKFDDHSLRCFMNVPFELGVISVLSKEPNAFSVLDVEMLEGIADILSVGVRRLEDMEALEKQYMALQKNETRYRNLIRMINGVVYELDWNSKKYTYLDESICDLIGYQVEEIDHGFLQSLVIEEMQMSRSEKIDWDIQFAFENPPTSFKSIYGVKSKDGHLVWVMDCSLEFRNDKGRLLYTLGILLDITEQRALEDGLRQSQKMEAIGQLAGGVAHDFNNLLTGILGLTSLLLYQLPKEHTMRSDIEEIQGAGQRAADLTRQLLAFSRKEVIEPKVLDLDDVVSGMQKMLRRLIREDIDLTLSLTSFDKWVRIDQGQLEQVIMNLVVNAKDAMPEGGVLSVKTDHIVLHAIDSRRLPELAPGSYVTLEVRDTGIGMDRATQRRIFEPFFTTKELGQGTGLGLATVYGIVAQNNGHIDVESLVGKGSAFKIYLPRAEKLQIVEDEACVARMYRGDETILVAEDEKMVRQFISRTLNDLGYTVREAENGEAALNIWQEQSGQIDLLITDMVMPDMGGKELVKRLLSKDHNLPILFISGYTEGLPMEEGAKGQAFLQKPFDAPELAQKIRTLLETVK